jgi:hypothetical protein
VLQHWGLLKLVYGLEPETAISLARKSRLHDSHGSWSMAQFEVRLET